MAGKVMRLRRADTCVQCGANLRASTTASWDAAARTVTCMDCVDSVVPPEEAVPPTEAPTPEPAPDPNRYGKAGASAKREFERRQQRRAEKIDMKWGRLAGVVKFMTDDPQSTKAWEKGSVGEQRLAKALAKRLGDRAVLIHDRKIPGTRANIDHLIVAATGIWIVDAKKYKGRVERRDVGGWFKTDLRLYVGGRDRTKLCDGMTRQVEAVRTAVGEHEVPIHPVLCFVDADWKTFAKPFELHGVTITWGKALSEMAGGPGALSPDEVLAIAETLVAALPPA